jgi:hypothetical protein
MLALISSSSTEVLVVCAGGVSTMGTLQNGRANANASKQRIAHRRSNNRM